ncbi:cupin-like domain-containing protein [Thalassotalea ganghwensis]
MLPPLKGVTCWQNVTKTTFEQEIQPLAQPAILKGLVKHWPCVQHSSAGNKALVTYLKGIYAGGKLRCAKLPRKEKGLFFYNQAFNGFNFTRDIVSFELFFEQLLANASAKEQDVIALQSAPLSDYFPEFEQQNSFDFLREDRVSRVWIGNDSIVNAHNDDAENIACVVAGKRRFTLFPPEQLANLYVGPIEFTPAGAPVSLVDFNDIDFERFPKVATALEHGLQAELEPGDAIYIPSLWWHHVEAYGGVNMLVNYWSGGAISGKNKPVPQDNLLMAMLSIRDLPQQQKDAWRAFFEYYIFSEQSGKYQHIPEHAHGVLDKLTPKLQSEIRKWLSKQLS